MGRKGKSARVQESKSGEVLGVMREKLAPFLPLRIEARPVIKGFLGTNSRR